MATLILVEDLAAPAVVGRGGHAMYVLQWLHGLRRLGHDVLFLEFLSKKPDEAALAYFEDVIGAWWSLEQAALIHEPSRRSLAGLDIAGVAAAAGRAEAIITLAAHYRREPWPLVEEVRPRLLVDTDPGYTQLWAADSDVLDVYGEHDLLFSVGANVGSPRCRLPTLGIRWRPVRNPVVLEWWSGDWPVQRERFTTVASWRDYGYLEFAGRMLGPRAEEFVKFLDLPAATGAAFELVLDIDPDDPDRELLTAKGWQVIAPSVVATPGRYHQHVAGSLAEFGCAKGVYVGTRSGWFSDRSACYLAAGRPAVLQATGFEDLLPTGDGLFAVHTLEQAADAVGAIRGDYARHASAARAIAREHLDSDRVLAGLLAEAGIATPSRRS